MSEQDRVTHWQNVYTSKGENEVSWFQDSASPSLELIAATKADRSAALIDIGGGASRLVDGLIEKNFTSVSVLDLSAAALDTAKARLGPRSETVRWIVGDATTWQPDRIYDLWHDRAAFHFLTSASDVEAYLDRMRIGTKSGSSVIIGTFALDGPEKCSGLVVSRYDAPRLANTLGDEFKLLHSQPHEHTTPWGAPQKFQFSTFVRL